MAFIDAHATEVAAAVLTAPPFLSGLTPAELRYGRTAKGGQREMAPHSTPRRRRQDRLPEQRPRPARATLADVVEVVLVAC